MLHFYAFVYCLMVISLHFLYVQRKSVVLHQMDTCKYIMFMVHVGHVYLVCGPRLVFITLVSVSSVRKIHRSSEPPAHVNSFAAAHERLTKNTAGLRLPVKGTPEIAGEFPLPRYAHLRFPGYVTLPLLAGCCTQS